MNSRIHAAAVLVFGAATILLLITACSRRTTGTAEEPLRIAFLPILDALPLHIAESEGYFSDSGFGGAGGFYSKTYKVIIISGKQKQRKKTYADRYSVSAKLEIDEVIVHELLHYCYFEEGKSNKSVGLNEEFAYGWSIGYLRKKGYTDDEL